MENVKILHCADVHIGAEESFLGFRAESRRRETLLTFEKIVDLCLENDIEVLLIAGDLFHSNNVEKSFFDAVISKIHSAKNLKVVYIAGNHDPLNPRSYFSSAELPQNLYILGGKEAYIYFEELNLRVYGRSFSSAFLQGKSTPDLIPPEDDVINIALIHGELGGAPDSPYNSISKEYIESSKMDYIALGHIHKRSDVGRIGDTYFAYSGCPEGQGFDELDQKGVLMGEVGKEFCNLEFIPTARRQHITEKIDISEITLSADYILNYLENKFGRDFAENLYKIELVGSITPEAELDIDGITARLNEKLYFAKIKDRTELKIDLEALSAEQSLKGIFVKKMLGKIQNTEEKEKYERALKLGLKAFSGEVNFDEN